MPVPSGHVACAPGMWSSERQRNLEGWRGGLCPLTAKPAVEELTPGWLAKCPGETPGRLQRFRGLATPLVALQAVLSMSTLLRGGGGVEGWP